MDLTSRDLLFKSVQHSLSLPSPTYPSRIQNSEERGYVVHLPIMHQHDEVNVPMNPMIAYTPKVSHHNFPIPFKEK